MKEKVTFIFQHEMYLNSWKNLLKLLEWSTQIFCMFPLIYTPFLGIINVAAVMTFWMVVLD